MKWTSSKTTKKELERMIRSGRLKRVEGYSTQKFSADQLIQKIKLFINENPRAINAYVQQWVQSNASTMANFGGWKSIKVDVTTMSNPQYPEWKIIAVEFPQTNNLNIYLHTDVA